MAAVGALAFVLALALVLVVPFLLAGYRNSGEETTTWAAARRNARNDDPDPGRHVNDRDDGNHWD